MKRYPLVLLLLLTIISAQAQKPDEPIPVTPALLQKFNAEIEAELPAFTVRYEKDNSERTDKFDDGIKFAVDTFKIERMMVKCMDADYSTAGMNKAVYEAAGKYDALMNKYYKLLSAKLQTADRLTLISAQKSWLAFRDSEVKLYQMLRKENYSGGGTIQSIFMSAMYLDMVKTRTLTLFEYYSDLYN